MITASKPTTIRSEVSLTVNWVEDAIRMGTLPKKGATEKKEAAGENTRNGKRKWTNFKKGTSGRGQPSSVNVVQAYEATTGDDKKNY
ncbi:MAG: hypothetical protein Q8755_03495, partial [Candidatus Phytoplasma australasiaticum]|nr:hypothetical protein [Candidatus Phytoplasma australasiaticum]